MTSPSPEYCTTCGLSLSHPIPCGHTQPEPTEPVQGVLTGQVPVDSMPVAMTSPRRAGKTAAQEEWGAVQQRALDYDLLYGGESV